MSRVPSARTHTVIALVLVGGAVLAGAPAPAPPPTINPSQARLIQTITGLDGPGFALAHGDAQAALAVGCERGTIQFWGDDVLLGVRLGGRTPSAVPAHQGPVIALAWNGGAVLASAGADQKVCLWSMPAGTLLRTLSSPGTVRALAMSADGQLLAAGTEASGTHIYDVGAGRAVKTLADLGEWVTAVVFSPDGKLLACGSLDGAVDLWETTTGRLLYRTGGNGTPLPQGPTPPANAVHALAFAADGKLLAAGGRDATIHLLNAADGKLVRSLGGHGGTVMSLAFHPAGALLASGSKDRTVRLWNVAAGQPFKVLEGHTSWVQGLAFLSRGTRLASTGADQTVRVWDLEANPKK